MQAISKEEVTQALDFPSLIKALEEAFKQSDIHVPMRHHHDYGNPKENAESTLLLMPAWKESEYLGVKIVTVSPENGKYALPSIQGLYLLNDAHKGTPLALMDAKELTVRRTAAASALASSYLSHQETQSMLMIGTGALAPHLIKAHATVRPIQEVFIWGRNFDTATTLAKKIAQETSLDCKPVTQIEDKISEVDLISCATLSTSPLVLGKYLKEGQHIDLVGAYKPNMREADDGLIEKVSLFVDTYAGATKETGDIVIPLQSGKLKMNEIIADLAVLCSQQKPGRTSDKQITCFKSVGHALEDLVAATLVWNKTNID